MKYYLLPHCCLQTFLTFVLTKKQINKIRTFLEWVLTLNAVLSGQYIHDHTCYSTVGFTSLPFTFLFVLQLQIW